MAHTLDHIVELRLEADPSLAWTGPTALGDYELPDFSVPPPYAGVYVPGVFGTGSQAARLAEYRAWSEAAQAPLVFDDPARQAAYDELRRIRKYIQSQEWRQEQRGEGVIAASPARLGKLPGSS